MDEAIDDTPRNRRRQQRVSRGDRANRVDEIIGRSVLEKEPGSPGAKGLEHVLIEVECRQDEYRRMRVRHEATGGFQAIHHRHLYVHQDQIWS